MSLSRTRTAPDTPDWPLAIESDPELWRQRRREAQYSRDMKEARAITESIMAHSDMGSSEKHSLSRMETSATTVMDSNTERPPLEVVGSTEIYDENGKIRLIPTPSPDPRDPLNLPNWRKYLAIGSLCFFGSLSLCADMVVASLLPVFLLEYSGVDPKPILKHANFKGNPNPMNLVPPGVEQVPLYQVTLLSTLPSLTNCVASFVLVPLSVAIGRRPVLILTALCSWIGGFWAAYSTTLNTHLMARVVHGLGSATVEALLPLVMQDFVFIHQRNRAFAAILACQGPMITVFGSIGPYVAVNQSWRWLYLISSAACVLAWVLIVLFVPETRKIRSKQELNGQQLWPIESGQNRTALDYQTYGRRTRWDDLGICNMGFEWKEAIIQVLRSFQVAYFPALLLVICIDAVFFIILQSMGQTISFALLAAGIPYELSGLYGITFLFSSAIIYLFGGPLADKMTLWISRKRNQTGREPEFQLPSLIVPILAAMIGCAVFGCSQHFHLHVVVMIVGSILLVVGSMTTSTILKTFIVESYPHWPGPVLVTVNTARTVISFGFSSHASTWVAERGYLFVFGIYIAVLFAISGFIPLFYFYGKVFRRWTAGRVPEDDGRDFQGEAPSDGHKEPDAPLTRGMTSSGETIGSNGSTIAVSTGSTTSLARTAMGSIDKTVSRVMSAETVRGSIRSKAPRQ